MRGPGRVSTEYWYSGTATDDDEENTHCQEDHADDDDQDEHETQRPPASTPLVFVCRGKLFGSTGGVDGNGGDI